jgi:hypothetical protein
VEPFLESDLEGARIAALVYFLSEEQSNNYLSGPALEYLPPEVLLFKVLVHLYSRFVGLYFLIVVGSALEAGRGGSGGAIHVLPLRQFQLFL